MTLRLDQKVGDQVARLAAELEQKEAIKTVLNTWLAARTEYCERVKAPDVPPGQGHYTLYVKATRTALRDLLQLNGVEDTDRNRFQQRKATIDQLIIEFKTCLNGAEKFLKNSENITLTRKKRNALTENLLIAEGPPNEKREDEGTIAAEIHSATQDLLRFAERHKIGQVVAADLLREHVVIDTAYREKFLHPTPK